MKIPRPRLMAIAACALGLCLAAPAHAQSSYVLTTLKAPSSGRVAMTMGYQGRTFGIDPSDQVVGIAYYYAGYYFDTNAPHFRVKYEPHVARWPAGTTASVSPAKLLKAPEWTYMDIDVSFETRKVLVYSSGQSVLDVATLKLGPKMPTSIKGARVNDNGVVAWNSNDYSGTFGTWTATGGTVVFPKPADGWVELNAINNQGVVVGSSQRSSEPLRRATKWVNGQLSVLDWRQGLGSHARFINEQGKVVATSFEPYCHGLTNCDSYNDVQGVLENGTFTPIAGPSGPVPYQVYVQTVNNAGLVAGYTLSVPGSDTLENRRAFILQGNTMLDVTELVQSKGVALPSGAVISNVLAINDKGSMVATMRSASGTTTLVRLTARP